MKLQRWKLEVFDRCVADDFAFLTTNLDFMGPERQPGIAIFHTPGVSVEVALDPRDGVLTLLVGHVGERTYRAELSCLYVAAGLGPAQHVHRSATSTNALTKSLASQAAALAKLLPNLTEVRRDDLLQACHGR